MIIRSGFAVTRLIVLPYGMLLALYFMVVGGGGTWLYYQVRNVETQLLMSEVAASLEPLIEQLRTIDAASAMRQHESWLIEDIRVFFATIPSLRTISVRGPDVGSQLAVDGDGGFVFRNTSALPVGHQRTTTGSPPAQRLHQESDASFFLSFDLTQAPAPQMQLDVGFDRSVLLERVNQRMTAVKRSIIGFGVVGAMSILLAIVITVVAMRVTRRMEVYFQEIYQRASMTEMSAALVHDLRNPLAALRANIKALLVSPEQTSEIVDELDRDIVSLNDKLSAFLNLTRRHDDDLESVDIAELLTDAVRLVEPVLSKNGLGIKMDLPPDLPQVKVRKASMRDALLNVLINAGQSGQTAGAVRITAASGDGAIRIAIEDRGKGIAEQHLPRLFDAFYTTREDGNGLGLAIVHRVVAAHQGQVVAENRPRGGARVVISLPLHPKETPAWWNKQKMRYPV